MKVLQRGGVIRAEREEEILIKSNGALGNSTTMRQDVLDALYNLHA